MSFWWLGLWPTVTSTYRLGAVLIVANGGILTHSDLPRIKLNFLVSSGMDGAFTIDVRTGVQQSFVSHFVNAGRWDNHLVSTNGLD